MVSFNPVLTSQKHRIVLGRFNKKSSRFWTTTKFQTFITQNQFGLTSFLDWLDLIQDTLRS